MLTATVFPEDVDVTAIRDAAVQAFFDEGFPVTGDFAPDEFEAINRIAENWVGAMALNNAEIAALNGD